MATNINVIPSIPSVPALTLNFPEISKLAPKPLDFYIDMW